MIFQIIDVDCYSGYKRGEKPRAFILHNHRYQIDAIVDRWYEGSVEAQRPILNYFKVQSEDKLFLLRYNPKFDTWAIRIDK
jgi:hypothetical protein